jgi:hypothetical protein
MQIPLINSLAQENLVHAAKTTAMWLGRIVSVNIPLPIVVIIVCATAAIFFYIGYYANKQNLKEEVSTSHSKGSLIPQGHMQLDSTSQRFFKQFIDELLENKITSLPLYKKKIESMSAKDLPSFNDLPGRISLIETASSAKPYVYAIKIIDSFADPTIPERFHTLYIHFDKDMKIFMTNNLVNCAGTRLRDPRLFQSGLITTLLEGKGLSSEQIAEDRPYQVSRGNGQTPRFFIYRD